MHLSIFFVAILLVLAVFPTTVQARCGSGKRVVTINPPTLFDPTSLGYSQVSLDTKNAVAYVAGQVSFNLTGAVIGTTLAEQLPVAVENVRLAMEAVGAGKDDILRLSIYVKDYQQARDFPVIQQSLPAFGSPAATLISTPALALDSLQVEIEVTAAVPYGIVGKYCTGACKCPA